MLIIFIFTVFFQQETLSKKANITSALEEGSHKFGAEENGFANQEMDMSNIVSPSSRPRIISQEILKPNDLPNNLTEMINSNVPLQNIRNKFSLGAHENLPDKQIYTLKKITNEKTKPLEKESNENLNIQKIIKVPERINFSSPIQQKDVNERSLNYLRRIQDLKQQINNLNKELQNKTKECERLQKTI